MLEMRGGTIVQLSKPKQILSTKRQKMQSRLCAIRINFSYEIAIHHRLGQAVPWLCRGGNLHRQA